MSSILCRGGMNMGDLLLISTFFVSLINLVLIISANSELIDIQADLYYYSEQKVRGKDDEVG